MPRVFLRAFEPGDHEKINEWRMDEEIMSMTGGNIMFVSKERERRWAEQKMLNDEKELYLAVCLVETLDMIGYVSLRGIDWRNRSAEIAVLIGRKELWSKGYGQESLRLLLHHGFSQLNLHRVYAYIVADNTASLRLFERLGFTTEGVLRETVFKNGRYHTQVLMSLLQDDYAEQMEKAANDEKSP